MNTSSLMFVISTINHVFSATKTNQLNAIQRTGAPPWQENPGSFTGSWLDKSLIRHGFQVGKNMENPQMVGEMVKHQRWVLSVFGRKLPDIDPWGIPWGQHG